MAAPLAWKNGRFVPPADLTLSAADAGFVSAATVTDFCRTYRHRLFRWPDHLARLRSDATAVRVPLPYPDAELTATAEELVARNAALLPDGDDLALITFATPGPLGHLLWPHDGGDEPRRSPTVGMHTFPLAKDRYRRFFADGVTLAVAGVEPAGGLVPGGVKHRSRLHWWLADHAARERFPGAVAVLTRPDGTAPDTAIGSVLVVRDGTVLRPRTGTVLEGVSLRVVAELCGRLGRPFAEADGPFPPPADVSEVLLCGSAFGVAGVRAVLSDGVRREFPWPGPVCRDLLAAWSETVGVDVAGQMLG